MAYHRKTKDVDAQFNLDDALSTLAEALTKQADPPNLLGYKPHEKQEEFHKSTSYGRWFLGGNRSGKSVAGTVEDLWWATKRHPYMQIPSHLQIRGRVVGSDFVNGIETTLFPIFKRWVLPSDLIGGSWEESYSKELKTLFFADGSFIEFRSSDQDLVKHAGTSRHFIHFDEEPPQVYFDENLQRLADEKLGRWWITMTPVEGMTWMADTMYEPEKPFPPEILHIVQVIQSDNPYLPKESREKALAFLSDDERRKREEGQFIGRGGKVLSGYSERSHFVLPVGWRPPSDWTIYTSQDHGFRTPAAVGWHAVHPSGRRIVTFHEIYGAGILVKDMANRILRFEEENKLKIFMRTGDPNMKQRSGATGTSILHTYAINGVNIGVEGVPRDESIGIDRMNDYLQIDPMTNEPYWQLTRECPKHNWEFKKLPWKTSFSVKNDRKVSAVEKVQDKDNHAFDECKYFFTFMQDLSTAVETPVAWSKDPYIRGMQIAATVPPDAHNPIQWDTTESFVLDQMIQDDGDYGWSYGD